MELLFLRLEGPLQSWGGNSKWDDRDSALMPTKSGVIGLLACCMGIGREDKRIEELSRGLSMAVRADRAGRIMTDFHTVQGRPRIMNAEGKARPGNTIVSRRQYLQDAVFTAALAGDEKTLGICADALKNPEWPPFLGRKSCVPTRPIFLELTDRYSSLEEGIRGYKGAERADPVGMAEVERPDGEAQRMDDILDAGRRLFGSRRISYVPVNAKEENS